MITPTGDIALILNPLDNTIDIGVANNDLVTDAGIQTAVLISLFTNQRTTEDDPPPDEQSGLGGWWGDQFQANPNDLIGSKLWLLRRAKTEQDTLNRAEEYSKEALQWMIDDGVAQTVDCSASYDQNKALILSINITKPSGPNLNYKYKLKWQVEADRG